MYLAIIADIINSKSIINRKQTQEELKNGLEIINQRFKKYLVSDFTLTLGDEFQALLVVDAPICKIIDTFEATINSLRFRYGIGYGEILTDIDPNLSIGADGPAFWNAREAIEWIHKENDYGMSNTYMIGKEPLAIINNLLAMCSNIKLSMTDKQRETLDFIISNDIYSDSFEQKEIATQMKLSESTLTKRLKSGRIKLYLRSRLSIDSHIHLY